MKLYHYTGPHQDTGKMLLANPAPYYRVADSEDNAVARTLTQGEALHIVEKQNRLALPELISSRKDWKYDPATLASGYVGPGNPLQPA